MTEHVFWRLVAALTIVVWAAFACAVAAHAGNPRAAIDQVEKSVKPLTPFRATVEQMPHGPRYVCRWYDDAPNANSIDFTWQVRVCRRITPAKRGPKA